jgi:hypothetical protein
MSNKKTLHNIFPVRAHKGGIIWPWTKWQRRNLSPKGAGYSLSVETLYRLDGPGFGAQRGWELLPRPWGPPSLLYNEYRVSFPGVKQPGRGVNHQLPSSAEVKERVELYLYSPWGPLFFALFQAQNYCIGKVSECHKLPPRLNWIIPSSGLLLVVRWFGTDVSGLPIGPIFKDQAV